jgi:hypothetical protein
MPPAYRFALSVMKPSIYLKVTDRISSLIFGSQVPVEDESLTLRVAGHPFTVAAELRIVRGEQLEPGQGPLAELVDDSPVAEDALHLPVGGQGTEIHDPHVPLRRLGLLQLFR